MSAKFLSSVLLIALTHFLYAQNYVIKDIKWFGAKGDGKTNDHLAFQKAATFFNKRGGNGKLIISKGTYLVGRQTFTKGVEGRTAYTGENLLHFINVQKFSIEGTSQSMVRFIAGLRFGAFDPQTGKAYQHGSGYFVNSTFAAFVGNALQLENSNGISISSLELDGNNQSLTLGGEYGDVGRQLQHVGINIINCQNIKVENVRVHHFGLDGIMISNKVDIATKTSNHITLRNSDFEYNGRQGLSWIGGNDLRVENCKFNHTGKGKYVSPPGAGVDIEAEVGPISNGSFLNCEFINNAGCGLVADAGNSRDCSFTNCTFWGVTAWSIWVVKPGFIFKDCKIYGSIVHGYNSPNSKDATTYKGCLFEDKPYNGTKPYGNFLIESNGAAGMAFTNCTMIAHTKKWCWLYTPIESKPEQKYQLTNCHFIMTDAELPAGDFPALIRGIRYKNCTFEFRDAKSKKKGYYLNDCCGGYNVDLGGNKIIWAS